MGYGVIGNTADSGSAILGSSPGTPAFTEEIIERRLGAVLELGIERRLTQIPFQGGGDAVDVITLTCR